MRAALSKPNNRASTCFDIEVVLTGSCSPYYPARS
jgi:hypothetical protein